jgi:hypothetical protein
MMHKPGGHCEDLVDSPRFDSLVSPTVWTQHLLCEDRSPFGAKGLPEAWQLK